MADGDLKDKWTALNPDQRKQALLRMNADQKLNLAQSMGYKADQAGEVTTALPGQTGGQYGAEAAVDDEKLFEPSHGFWSPVTGGIQGIVDMLTHPQAMFTEPYEYLKMMGQTDPMLPKTFKQALQPSELERSHMEQTGQLGQQLKE